jgi:hypothetical protein
MEIMELSDVSVFNVLRVEETRHRVGYTCPVDHLKVSAPFVVSEPTPESHRAVSGNPFRY